MTKWNHLHPRTATVPIRLDEFIERERREIVVNSERLNPAYISWIEERVRQQEAKK